jgi:biopolymer transport protein TolR
MPAVASRSRHRRTINEINMVPFIDVMLVLLIIFMVSAPLITTGLVELPSVGKGKQQPKSVIEIVVGADDSVKLRVDKGEPQTVPIKLLGARVRDQQAGSADIPVVISADKAVRYETVVKVMDTLQRNGVQRVGLAVKTGGA